MVAGILNLMGIFVGQPEDLLEAASDNEKGYFERSDIVKIDSLLLASQHANWFEGLGDFSAESIGQSTLDEFDKRAGQLIKNELDTHQPWLLKDPRMCLTFSVWKRIIKEPVIVLVYRHPDGVAQSLSRRNKFSKEYALALWEKYMLEALRSTVSCPRIVISYEVFLQEANKAVKELYTQLVDLGVPGLHFPTEEELKTFIDPSLNHSQARQSRDDDLNELQRKLVKALDDKSVLTWTTIPELSETSRKLLNQRR